MNRHALLLVAAILVVGCASSSLTPANVAQGPGGAMAVSFTRTFPPGFWTEGDHAYRLVVTCPAQQVGPPAIRFRVSDDAPLAETVYLRFDGPGRHLLSPADLPAVHPAATTVAVVTLAGMTAEAAEEARTACEAMVVYDGLDPESLAAGAAFSP